MPVIDTGYMTIVTPNQRDKSDSNRCVIEFLGRLRVTWTFSLVIRIF